MDESKRRFIKQAVGLLAASGLVAGRAKHAEAVEPPEGKGPKHESPSRGLMTNTAPVINTRLRSAGAPAGLYHKHHARRDCPDARGCVLLSVPLDVYGLTAQIPAHAWRVMAFGSSARRSKSACLYFLTGYDNAT